VSHGFVAGAIGQRLAERGHDVTVVAWTHEVEHLRNEYPDIKFATFDFRLDKAVANLGLDDIPIGVNITKDSYKHFASYIFGLNDPVESITQAYRAAAEVCLHVLSFPDVQKAYKSADLHIVDRSNPCSLMAAYIFGLEKKVLAYTPVGTVNSFLDLGPVSAATVPAFSTRSTPKSLGFLKSLPNFFEGIILRRLALPEIAKQFCKHYLPTWIEKHGPIAVRRRVQKDTINFDVALCSTGALNRHISEYTAYEIVLSEPPLEFNQPFWSNVKLVGHPLSKAPEPLKQDHTGIKEFVESSSESGGFVLVSLGSVTFLSPEKKKKLALGLSSISPLKVIWKVTGEFPDQSLYDPNQIKVVSWMPQNDLLGHPNCRLFVSHCGMNSIQEAAFHGVPILGIPLGGDQVDNIYRPIARGFAMEINQATFTVDILNDALAKMLSDDSFKSNALLVSKSLKAHPRHSLDRIADWAERTLVTDIYLDLNPRERYMAYWRMAIPDIIICGSTVIVFFGLIYATMLCVSNLSSWIVGTKAPKMKSS